MIYEYSRVAVKATGAAQDNTVAGTLNPDILLQIENLPRRKIPGPLSSRKKTDYKEIVMQMKLNIV